MSVWVTRPAALVATIYIGLLWMHGLSHELAMGIVFGIIGLVVLMEPDREPATPKKGAK